MYSIAEYICTIISILNCLTALIIYFKDKKLGVSVDSGKHFKSFKICITMSIIFGTISMLLTFNNLEFPQAPDNPV
ncbi:hypothetical protein SBY92_005131 [Candida maltosa Xu316]